MRTLMNICEGILGDIDTDVENYVEAFDKMKKAFTWVKQIKVDDAVYYEAALFNITQGAFRKANPKSDPEFKRLLGFFMVSTWSPWSCDNAEETENWEERTYSKSIYPDPRSVDLDIIEAKPDDYRWNLIGSGSFYHFFWDSDYIHSLDQEELLINKKTQTYSKKLQDTAAKLGLKLKPIF